MLGFDFCECCLMGNGDLFIRFMKSGNMKRFGSFVVVGMVG